MKASTVILLAWALLLPLGAHPDAAHSLAELDRHLAETPDDAILHLRRAELLLKRNHPETARPSVEAALRLSPDDPAVLLLRARLSYATGDIPATLAAAGGITGRFPDYAPAWDLLARLHREQGSNDDAIAAKLRHLACSESVDPGDFLTASSWLRERNRTGDTQLSLEMLDRGIARYGSLTVLQQAAIPIECSLGRHDDALRRVQALVLKYQPSAAFSLLRADICEAAGRYPEAASACDSAVALLDAQPDTAGSPLAGYRDEILRRKQENLGKAGAAK